ncbi:MAG: hypothetical protein ACRET3_03650, partial [Burkholderiales bacterium]
GGELYLPRRTAIELVRAADAADIAVVGIEAVLLDSSSTEPLLDQIADFSAASGAGWRQRRKKCNHAARRFLTKLGDRPGLHVTLVLEDRPIPTNDYR